jgi:DNA-binding transcriptional LysR family regulator
MELHQIRYFLALCETMNFTRAAMNCRVAQPSLTRAIKVLELELGGPLFNRERGNTHLTELGAAVAPHLREAQAQALAAQARAAAQLGLRAARLSLGVGFGVAPVHITCALRRFAASHPEVEITLHEDDAAKVREDLRRGNVAMALLPERPHDIDDLHYLAVGADRAQLLMRRDHRLATLAMVSLAELADELLVTRAGCRFLPTVERWLTERGLTLRPRLSARTAPLVAALVEASGGVGLSEAGFGVPAGLSGAAIVELAEDLPVFAATKRGRPHSPPLKALIGLLSRPPAPIGMRSLLPPQSGDTVPSAASGSQNGPSSRSRGANRTL